MTPAAVRVAAPAKVNLSLHVLGRRSDGYHDLETLFQAVSLYDDVFVRPSPTGVTLEVAGAEVGSAEDNLAHRAARAWIREAGTDAGFHVRLVKRIPAGAGLGGGSSDAAAVLRAANALSQAPLDGATLHRLGAELGSDVPFFLGESALARGTGRGERLEPHSPLPEATLLLVLPPVHVSTAEAYGALARSRDGGGEPPCFGRVFSVPATWADVTVNAQNDFETVVPTLAPDVGRALATLRDIGAAPALLSGSGSACFGVFADPLVAEATAAALRARLGWTVSLVKTLSTLPAPEPISGIRGG